MVNEGPDREFYETCYPRKGRAKKTRADRELSNQRPTGFFYARRRNQEPDMDALEQQFQDEMTRAGREDIALDDSEAYADLFDKWLRRRGYE
jgi:hypothetical protein